MKAMIITLTFLSVSLLANDGRYLETMQKNIERVYTAQTPAELQDVVNTFDRIASAEKTKWEPYYYAAFGNIMIASREKEAARKDQALDLAIAAITKAKEIAPQEAEVIALEGFAHMIRVTVDPASRGQQYSGLAMQTYGKALALNPENPRALALLAQMQYGTAQFFGSSTAEACATASKAIEKFDTYKSENPLAPSWGKSTADRMKQNCR